MTVSTQRTAVYNAVVAADSTAKIYDYERFSNDYTDFLSLFSNGSVIYGWIVVYGGQSRERVSFDGKIETVTKWKIIGLMSVDDSAASEKTFTGKIETVMDAVDGVSGFWHVRASNNTVAEMRVIGSVLCHYAEIELEIMERV